MKNENIFRVIGFHGTHDEFDVSEIGKPAFFTSDQNTAEYFTNSQLADGFRPEDVEGWNPRVVCAVIEARHPLEVDVGGQSWGELFLADKELFDAVAQYAANGNPEERAYFQEKGINVDYLADYAQENGYDLLIAKNVYEECGWPSDEYIALEGSSIREATEQERASLEQERKGTGIALENMLLEGEAIAEFTTTDSPAFNTEAVTYHFIVDGTKELDRQDLAGCLEDTMHRLLEAGAEDGDIEAVMGAVPADQAVDIGNGITEIDLGYVIPGQVTSVAFVRTESSVGLEDAIGEADTIANSKARYIDTDDHEDSPKWQEAL